VNSGGATFGVPWQVRHQQFIKARAVSDMMTMGADLPYVATAPTEFII
jgi:hypothetical protein